MISPGPQTVSERLDWWLNRKVFTRIADWADYHFSRNHYDLAIYCLMAELGAIGLLIGLLVIERSWPAAGFNAVVSVGLFYLNKDKIGNLEICSRKYESEDTLVPAEAIPFFASSPFMRMFPILLGIVIGSLESLLQPTLWFKALIVIGFAWIMWGGFATYFAICLRPPKARQKKKAPDFSGALQPLPVSS